MISMVNTTVIRVICVIYAIPVILVRCELVVSLTKEIRILQVKTTVIHVFGCHFCHNLIVYMTKENMILLEKTIFIPVICVISAIPVIIGLCKLVLCLTKEIN